MGCGVKSPAVAGLTGQIVKEIEKPVSKAQEAPKEDIKEIKRPVQILPNEKRPEKSSKFYDLQKLEEDLKKMANVTYNFTRNPSHPDYIRSSFLEYYEIGRAHV